MSYIDLINRFWQEVDVKGWTPVETNIYFRLLDICNRSGWQNPFTLSNPRAVALMAITENTLSAGRDKLAMKGLIGFKKGSRRSDAPLYCFPEKVDGEWVFPESFTSNFEAKQGVKTGAKQGVKTGAKPMAINKSKIKSKILDNNKILLTRTREEIELQRFDELLQEVVDGKHQLWEEEMRKKHRIENVKDYLPSFRSHVIANAKMATVTDINGFKQYFNVAFRFFSKSSPLELLGHYEQTAQSEPYSKFCRWVAESAPNIVREIIPLTEDEFTRLREVYGSEKIASAVLSLSNRRDLVAKYYSLYQTLVQWLEKDYNN